MIDKSLEVEASLQLVNKKLHFEGLVEGNEAVSIDYIPPFGDNLGYTSLELLLLCLSSCVGSAVLIFLRKMQKDIVSFQIQSKGFRKQEHPTGFKQITMQLNITCDNLTVEEVAKVLQMTESTYCPVWSMLKGNVEVLTSININPANA